MSLPPGPDLPPWLTAQAWIERPVDLWQECAAKFGDTFTLQLGSLGPTVLFSDPKAVRQIFQLTGDVYECRQFNDHYRYVMGQQSLLVSDGSVHRRRRSLLLPSLHQGVVRYAAVIREVTRQIAEGWPVNEPFSVRPSLHVLSLQVMLRMVFGTRQSD